MVRACLAAAAIAAGLIAVTTAESAPSTAPAGKLGIASSRYLASDPAMLSRLGAGWAYDWSATAPRPGRGPAWVPMVWGSGSVTPAVIGSLTRDRRSGRARDLLGFNEPDSTSQSNLTPAAAAALWPALQRTGLALGSPAPQVPTDGWLARFMALVRARHLRVNFIALHYYQDFTDPDAVAQLRAQLIAIHRTYHRPIWITELGAIDLRAWGEPMLHAPTAVAADRYMRSVVTMLTGLPFVARVAWFTDDCWNTAACRDGSLVDGAGQITSAGRTFEALAGQTGSGSSN